jgi:type I restriction enzyme, S subunit
MGTRTHSWQSRPLSDLLTERDETPSVEELASGAIRIIAKIGFNDGKIQVRPNANTRTGMILVRPGDLVVSGINAAKGAIAMYDEQNQQLLAATIHYASYIPNHDRVDIRFLWWLLRSQVFREILNTNLPGGIKTELKSKRLLPVEVPLPPLFEQRRIVSRIDELSARIKGSKGLRQKASVETEALITAALRRSFNPRDGWRQVSLQAVSETIIDNLHSNPLYADSGVPCVRSPDVGWGEIYLGRALTTSDDEYKRRTVRGEPRPDDIVLVREGGGTGKAALVTEGQRFSLGQRVMMIRPNKAMILPKFFLYQLMSPHILQDQIPELTKGSASPHLNIGALKKFSFLLPPLERQTKIVAYLDELKRRTSHLQRLQSETAAELDALMPSILSKAFRGEL